MQITQQTVAEVLDEYAERLWAVSASGGIPEWEVSSGREVPEGWRLDPETCFYVPPSLILHGGADG